MIILDYCYTFIQQHTLNKYVLILKESQLEMIVNLFFIYVSEN